MSARYAYIIKELAKIFTRRNCWQGSTQDAAIFVTARIQ